MISTLIQNAWRENRADMEPTFTCIYIKLNNVWSIWKEDQGKNRRGKTEREREREISDINKSKWNNIF